MLNEWHVGRVFVCIASGVWLFLFNLAGFLGYLLATVYFHSLKVSTLN